MVTITREDWEKTESGLRDFPKSGSFSTRVRAALGGSSTACRDEWIAVGQALTYCTEFPNSEFENILRNGDFDVRWPLTFACAYWSFSGASIDRDCRNFLTRFSLWDEARAVLQEYVGPDWMTDWRTRFEADV